MILSVTLLHLHDHALPAPLFNRLWRAVRAVGDERLKQSYWTTFWYDFGPPRNAVDAAVVELRARYASDWGARGVEWWLGRTDLRRVPIELHADRDNHLFDETGRLRHPRVSSVLYFNRVRGGALAVFDQRQRADGTPVPARPRETAIAAPRPNRFVHFPGNRVHAVLDANNEMPSRPLRLPPMPLRWALVVNWWGHRPRRVPEWDGAIYPSLGR